MCILWQRWLTGCNWYKVPVGEVGGCSIGVNLEIRVFYKKDKNSKNIYIYLLKK